MACFQSNVDWQSTKNTVLERNCHMFNNSDMSDISFTCEGADKTYYAHKYVLGTSSAVFYAMFYGDLADKDSVVHLSDTNKESLEEFLRFLYTEQCTLTSDNVVSVMYLAKKYIVPSLCKKCTSFLMENLSPENVLDVLTEATRFDENELAKKCWEVVQSDTNTVVTSHGFNGISHATLVSLLARDDLTISEVKLFQAVLKWIDSQCSRNNLKPTGENRRSTIGEAIYGFRFFSMNHTEFVQNVSTSGLLTAEELNSVYEKFLGVDSPALKWKLPNRKPRSGMVRFTRFSWFSSSWGYSGLVDCLCFSVNKDALLFGVRLFGNKAGSNYNVSLEVKDGSITRTYNSETNENGIPGFDVMFKIPITLKKHEIVSMSAKVAGPSSYSGQSGVSEITVKGVFVKFSNASSSPNGTFTVGGQFHEIILSI